MLGFMLHRLCRVAGKTTVVIIASGAVVAFIYSPVNPYRRTDVLAYLRSRLIGAFRVGCDQTLRMTFQRKIGQLAGPVSYRPQLGYHSHPEAALTRTRIFDVIDDIVSQSGVDSYSVSMSANEQKSGQRGSRYYYWSKDLRSDVRNDEVRPTDVYTMKDVDYHIPNINQFLDGHSVIAATLLPSQSAGTVGPDAAYCFEDNQLRMVVSGCAEYKHMLWDYRRDEAYVKHWWGGVEYHVDVFMLDPIRAVVCATPVCVIYGPVAWLFPETPITRMAPLEGGFNTVTRFDKGNVVHSIADNGSFFATEITHQELLSLATRRCEKTQGKPLALYDTKTSLTEGSLWSTPDFVHSRNGDAKTLVHRYVNARWHLMAMPRLIAAGFRDTTTYIPASTPPDEPVKATMTARFPCLYGPESHSLAPAKCREQDVATVKTRITDLHNPTPTPGNIKKYMIEFVRMLVEPNELIPLDVDAVSDLQNRPSQRAGFEQRATVMDVEMPAKPSAFMKKEPVADGKPARNITTLDAVYRTQYSRYTLPLSRALKRHAWYVSGRNPDEIARGVHSAVSRSKCVQESDFSKMDGTTPIMTTELVELVFKRGFTPEHAAEANRLNRLTLNMKVYTTEGITYDTGVGTLSGRPDTSIRSTLTNGFLNYCANRIRSMRPKDAWARLGLYSGDDGLTPDGCFDTFQKVCKSVGYKVTNTTRVPGDYMTFLGRIYLNAWAGPESVCDVKRILRRFPLVIGDNLTAAEYDDRLISKATGLLVTDPETPVVGDMCRAVLRIKSDVATGRFYESECSHASRFKESPYPQRPLADNVEVCAELLETDTTTVERIMDILNTATTQNDLLPAVGWLNCERDSTFPIIVDGDLLNAPGGQAGIIVNIHSTSNPLPTNEERAQCAKAETGKSRPATRKSPKNTARAPSSPANGGAVQGRH